MIFYKNGKFEISKLKVHYKDVSEGEVVKYVGIEGREYWEEFSKMWDDFQLISFLDVEISEGQLKRLEEINELGLQESTSLLCSYVEFGDLSNVKRGHPLHLLILERDLKESNLKNKAIATRQDFQEELIAELAMKIYD